ncbi:MAG: hypothetical protein ACXVBH_02840 [Flavisolibacter sp.]
MPPGGSPVQQQALSAFQKTLPNMDTPGWLWSPGLQFFLGTVIAIKVNTKTEHSIPGPVPTPVRYMIMPRRNVITIRATNTLVIIVDKLFHINVLVFALYRRVKEESAS